MPDSLQSAARLLAASLEPLAGSLADSDDAIIAFIEQLGWTLPSVPPSLKSLGATAKAVSSARLNLDISLAVQASGGNVSANIGAQYIDVASNVAKLLSQLHDLPSALPAQLPAAFVAATNFPSQFPRRLLDFCVYELMVRNTRRMEPIMRLAGLIEVVEEAANPAKFQAEYLRRTIRWDRLGKFLKDPSELLTETYGWGGPSFDGRAFLDAIMHLSFALAGPAAIDWPKPARIQALTGTLPTFDAVGPPQLIVPLIQQGPLLAEISILPLLALAGAPPGIAFGLFIGAGVPATAELSSMLTLQLDRPEALAAGVSIALRPGRAPQIRIGLEGPTGSNVSAGRTGATIRFGRADPMQLLSLPGGLALETKAVSIGGGVTAASTGPEPYFDIGLVGGKLTLSPGGRDAFLEKIIPGGPIELNFDLELVWSPSGVTIRGSGELTVAIPLHQQLGPFELQSLYIVGTFKDNGLQLETSVSGSAELGPITASVDRLGVKAIFVPKAGNLGPLDLQIGFKPPNGLGLSIEAGIVSGGGYLYFDFDKQEYAGVFELSIAGIVTVKAIGLITTKMPDGSKGFSLLIIITAEFATGIQLGFGFTLLGVGGLLGLNRTMLIEPIASGIRTGAINSIMFPPDPVKNAPRIISDLRTYFPPYEGKFLIGPMLKIGWGTPTIVSLSLGLIIEIPGNVAIVGLLRVVLPAEEAPLMVINIGFVGAMEFDKRRVWFFASMFDSRILFMTMEGDMGLLMDFSDNPNFVLSVGGFHPQFNPPPLPFPNPRRIHIDVLRNPVQRITVENYFAITSNTVQLGARAELFYGIDAFNLHGSFSFDALFQFSPFHFIIQISFSVGMDVFGAGVFSVTLKFMLRGPAPWQARGTATLSIDLWLFSIDISVDFDISWGEADNPKLPSVEAIPILVGEFNKSENWRARLPQNANLLVSLRELDSAGETLVLHPLGTLRIVQRVVPLNLQIDKISNNPVSDAHLFGLQVNSPGLDKTAQAPTEKFAIAQFQNLSEAEKLSRPSFQNFDGGVELAFAGRQLGSIKVVKRVVRYEVKIMDGDDKHRAFKWFKSVGTLFYHWLDGAAVTKSPLSLARQKSLVPTEADERVKVGQSGYVVAAVTNNKAIADAPIFASEAQARDFLNATVSKNSGAADELHVIPKFEAA
jgi:hypothetical protein